MIAGFDHVDADVNACNKTDWQLDVVKQKGTNPLNHKKMLNRITVLWRRQYTSRH